MRGLILGTICSVSLVLSAGASPIDDLADRFYDEDPTVKAEIEACAPTVVQCAVLKGEGLAYGMAGWPEDVSAAIAVFTKAAQSGATEAMTGLAYIYEDEDMSVYDMDKATEWYGRAAVAGDADIIMRGINAREFLNLGFEQATKFSDWKRIKLGNPRKRKGTVMGYSLDDKPPVLEADAFADLRAAQKAYATRSLTEYGVWTILKLAAEDDPTAMRIYGEMVRDGYAFEQNIETADAFLLAARTWE